MSSNTHTPQIHPLIAARHSPYALDAQRDITVTDLQAVLEAARWAPSSYNAQPWRYIVGVRGRSDDTRSVILDLLAEGNQPWARHAPVLMLGLVREHFEHNGALNAAAEHDLGAASMSLSLEAAARGLAVHQMKGFDAEAAKRVFDLPDGLRAVTALALGYPGAADAIPEAYAQRDAQPRERKSLPELIFAGGL